MGFGISCTCTKCNAKQEFFLGVGYLNFADPINPTEKVVYIFPKCSDWKEETICQDDKKRRQCSKCKAAMRKISDKKGGIDFSKLPKIVCKECGDNFKIYAHIFFWD